MFWSRQEHEMRQFIKAFEQEENEDCLRPFPEYTPEKTQPISINPVTLEPVRTPVAVAAEPRPLREAITPRSRNPWAGRLTVALLLLVPTLAVGAVRFRNTIPPVPRTEVPSSFEPLVKPVAVFYQNMVLRQYSSP